IEERCGFGNLLGTVLREKAGDVLASAIPLIWPPPFAATHIFPQDQDIFTRFTYEPQFQNLTLQSDPRGTIGLIGPPLPTIFIRYDYQANGALNTITHPPVTLPDSAVGP